MCYYCRFKDYILSAAYQIQVPAGVPENTSDCQLYINTGAGHLSFVVLNAAEKEFIALQHFNLDKHKALTHCQEIVSHNEWFNKSYSRVVITYNFGDSILVPAKLYIPTVNNASLELIYGDLNKGRHFADHLPEWELYNIYRVPEPLHNIFAGHFTAAEFVHGYSSFLKVKKQTGNTGGDELNVVFYNNKLIVSLFRNDEVMLIRSFEYETSEDVAYYLLNICRQFNVNCETVTLVISGLIDDHSAVYAELQKYFMFLQLNQRPAGFKYSEAFDEYPPHFFTAVFNAALCG